MSWDFFKLEEFACRCGCGQNKIDHQFVTKLDWLRGELGFPLAINSGYRCPEHNAAVSSTGLTGPHTTGLASDVRIAGEPAWELLEQAFKMKFRGIGVNQKGEWPQRYIHLDILDRKRVWSY